MLKNTLPKLALTGLLAMAALPAAAAPDSQASEIGHDTPALNFFDFSSETSHPLAALLFNFGALVVIVYLLLRKPLGNRFHQRRAELVKSLDAAIAAKARAESAIDQANARSQALEAEMAQLKADIVAAAENEGKAIVARAEAQAARLITDTESLVNQEIAGLVENLREEIVGEIVARAAIEIKRTITDADHHQLAKAYLEQLDAAVTNPVKH